MQLNSYSNHCLLISFLKFKDSQNEQCNAADHTDNAGYYFNDRTRRPHAGTDRDSAYYNENSS